MAFTRNTGTNLFPLILGLFLEIGGTSSRILNTLSNAGACVSVTTIEHLKKILSEDAVAYAVSLMQSPGMFYIIFDNINIFLRKSQQRLFNKNSMTWDCASSEAGAEPFGRVTDGNCDNCETDPKY
ncbi:hypothetical protein B0H19DRAFT_1253504 [Mycena capillaripes]|nr:hypothetical protein B0H19DRAFT_1253504 [Mycena capillaripes]